MCSLVCSFNWISQGTRDGLSIVTSLLAQNQDKFSHGHLKPANCAICYVKGKLYRSIMFSIKANIQLELLLHFLVPPSKIEPFTDADWGPQYQSIPDPFLPPIKLDTFKSRSMLVSLIMLNVPLHWTSKR